MKKTTSLTVLALCAFAAIIGISHLFPPTVYLISVKSIISGDTNTFKTYRKYTSGDTTFRERVYGVVLSIDEAQ